MNIFNKIFSPPAKKDEPAYFAPLEAGNYEEAIPFIRESIARDDAHAMGILATLYALGRGVKRDLQEACIWYRQAAVRGDVSAQAAFGYCLAAGIGTDIDRREAAYWLHKAAVGGNAKAAVGLGDLIFQDQSLLDIGLFTAREVNDLVLAARRAEPSIDPAPGIH